ncbi:unnamed protein product [Phytophthora fragariaefolia]|uniref:Unnamed protein product n=1 Tax=Phytophthora fragariaefolia TaxID=1490495 RepID=A0A9W6YHV1_9STRA|nr:unnamed protein product [Phytophthora fragariaefolia]
MGNPRPVERNLVTELDASADDDDDEDDQGVVQGERPPLIPRATRNADMPSANKVLARLGEEMRTRSEWMMMFAPVAMAQAGGPVPGPELTQPINSTGINQLVEDTVLLLKAMVAEFPQLGADPSRVLLPNTPDTKRPARGERFRSTVGTPYFEDLHMLTPKKGKPRGGRYDHRYDASDEAELGDSRDDSADPRGDRDETVKDQIRRLNYDEAERDNSQYLELRTHFSRDKVAEFEGKRRKENEPIYDFWIRLNGYARTAKIQYEMGGADAADHVEQFLLNCGDDGIMDLLYPLQLADIQRVEQIINNKILGVKEEEAARSHW